MAQLFQALMLLGVLGAHAGSSISASDPSKQPFCLPSDPCWPSTASWTTLNTSVQGRLAQLGKASNCEASWDSVKRPTVPVCMMWTNCLHVNCSIAENFASPTYAVHVASVSDVQAAVSFAAKYRIRLTVKTTGHDFVGRSNAADGLLVWMHGFNEVSVIEQFTDVCNASLTIPAMQAQGGAVWGDLYPKIPANFEVVGGNALTVSVAGGYLQGGGHSCTSPSLGLAVDAILYMEVVTTDGQVRKVTRCDPDTSDLFFALAGGGGGTFGIVTSVTLKMYPTGGSAVGLQIIVPLLTTSGGPTDAAKSFFSTYMAMQPSLDSCWGGFILGTEAFGPKILLINTMCLGSWKRATESISPLLDWAKRESISVTLSNHTSFYAWHGKTVDPLHSVGVNTNIASRIMPIENFVDTAKAQALSDTILQHLTSTEDFKTGLYIIQLGGAVKSAPDQASTSVTDGFRNGQWHVIGTTQYGDEMADEAKTKGMVAAFQRSLAAQAPTGGTYFNEMMYDQPDWQQAFFGKNYARLLQIKQKYDPTSLLQCHNCVGSHDVPAPAPPAPAPQPPSPPSPTPPSPSPSSDTCASHPKCADEGLSGSCCPTRPGGWLDCCPTIYNAACSANPKCAAEGIEGDCCPTSNGHHLDCCGGSPPPSPPSFLV